MSLVRRLAGPLLALSALCGALLPAQAQNTTASLTVDNVYALYSGVPSSLTLLGSNSAWQTAENYSFNAAAGSFVYVAAWNQDGLQGFQGVVAGPDGTFRSNLTDWVVTVIPSATFPGWRSVDTTLPQITLLQTALGSATWEPVTASRAHNVSPWGGVVSDPATLWIWKDAFEGGTTTGSLVVFRTLTPVVSAIPEPGSSAMMLLGVGVLGFLYRRRMQSQA